MRLSLVFLCTAFFSIQSAQAAGGLGPVLDSLLVFHPGFATKSITQDSGVHNEKGFRVLFDGHGEGRILKIWLATGREKETLHDDQQFWIIIDGQTAFRGRARDYFEGRGPFKAPLVRAGEGGILSLVPFAYAHDARVLFKGNPPQYRIDYREGAGAAAGPTASELSVFLAEKWAGGLSASLAADAVMVSPTQSLTLAKGPTTVSAVALKLDLVELKNLKVKVGAQASVPAEFFFGHGQGASLEPSIQSAIFSLDSAQGVVATRMPVPLAAGESLTLESTTSTGVWVSSAVTTAAPRSGVHLTGKGYEFTDTHESRSEITQGEGVRIFDSASLPGGPFYTNDHTLIQGTDARWHLFGIFNHEPFGSADEFSFVHAVSDGPELANLRFKGTLLNYDPSEGETHVWAPHVVSDGAGGYVMAFHSGGADNDSAQISIARSTDLENWQRLPRGPVFKDICVARDPMLKRFGATWVMYYTRCNDTKARLSGVAYRTSLDLVHWSAPFMAISLPGTSMFNSGYTESPFIFERGGWFYLSFTSYPIEWVATQVFRSRSPFHFDGAPVARLRSHAAEWVATDNDFEHGELFMTHCGAGQGGVFLMPMQLKN